jgi:hypothetical protein
MPVGVVVKFCDTVAMTGQLLFQFEIYIAMLSTLQREHQHFVGTLFASK